MLQIISTKFFKGNDLHVHQGKGIIYSNYSWVAPIITTIATLEPVDYHGSSKAYVISYENKIEKSADGGFALVRTGDQEIIKQFQLLCTIGLGAYFNSDKIHVDNNCRERSRGMGDNYVPSKFVPRFFKPEIDGSIEEIEYLQRLVTQAIGLSREDYKNVINCLDNFSNALEIVNYNLDLAYSMLVYSMEALSKKYNDYTPVWADYEFRIKNELETHLLLIEEGIAQSIKDTLVNPVT